MFFLLSFPSAWSPDDYTTDARGISLNNRETLRSKTSGESYYNPTIPTGGTHRTRHSLPLSPIDARATYSGAPFRETHIVPARTRQGSDASRTSGRKVRLNLLCLVNFDRTHEGRRCQSFEPIVFTRDMRAMAGDEDKYDMDP